MSGKQQLFDRYGRVAADLLDRVSAIQPSLGHYLIAGALGGHMPPNTDFRRRHAMRIAALATQGETGEPLAQEIKSALDADTSAAEIVEIIFHAFPYAGIPKPLNSLLAAKEVFRGRGLLPVTLTEPSWTQNDRDQVGEEQISHAHPAASPALKANLAEIAPSVYDYIRRGAFADVYGRPGLVYPQRQPLTIVSLAAQGNVRNHLTTHVNGALNIGLEPITIVGALIDTLPLVEFEMILDAVEAAQDVFAERGVAVDGKSISPGW